MIKVSVIIPFYNQSIEFIKQAISSAINQTLKEIEIICIDDGSTNNECFDYINKIEKQDSRIKLYKKTHTGSGETRNMGINFSTGENIMFLDSDDYYPENNILEKLYNILKKEEVLIAGGKHLILNNGKLEEPYFNYGDINQFFCNKTIKYSDYQFPWWYWCFIYNSKLIKDNNIKFPPYLRYQDPPFFVKVMDSAKYFYAANFISYIHRNSDRLFSLDKNQAFDHVRGIANLLKYSDENNLDKLHTLLYNTFFSYDIKILEEIKDISIDEKREIEYLITKNTNRSKIH